MTANPTQLFVENTEAAELQTLDPDIAATFKVSPPQVEPAVETGECEIPPVVPLTESILLVDDEDSVRRLARLILEASGYTVVEASSGAEAIETCKSLKHPPGLLLTDVAMPQMSGPALGKEVTKLYPDISVLYMSGYDDQFASHSLAPDETPFLQKPFSPAVLVSKVRHVLDTAETRRLIRANLLRSQASNSDMLSEVTTDTNPTSFST